MPLGLPPDSDRIVPAFGLYLSPFSEYFQTTRRGFAGALQRLGDFISEDRSCRLGCPAEELPDVVDRDVRVDPGDPITPTWSGSYKRLLIATSLDQGLYRSHRISFSRVGRRLKTTRETVLARRPFPQ